MKTDKLINPPKFILPVTTKFLFDKNLTDFDKILYIVISTLSAKTGYCFANNEYLAQICNSSVRNIQYSLARLKKYDHIYVEIKSNNQRILKTYLSICADKEDIIKKSFNDFEYDWLNEV